MKLQMYGKRRKKFLMRVSILILILLIILALLVSSMGVNSDKKISTADTGKVVLSQKNIPVVKIPKDKNGNIYMQQNKIYKKYTVNISSANKNVSYEESGNLVVISFNKGVPLTGNTQISDSNLKDINITEANGKENLLIKKVNKDNNFVNINEGKDNNQVIILISKVKKPLTHKAVLNPGHGGLDSGTTVGNFQEKNITLRIVKLMVSDLEYSGVEVVLTRDKDEGQALADIADFANKNKPDVFMSVHINCMTKNPNKYSGIGAYYYDENGYQTNERMRLANTVIKNTTLKDGWKNDGVVRAKYKVIRLSKAPSVLVEAGYLTNVNDRARLQDERILGNLANNLSKAIVEFVH